MTNLSNNKKVKIAHSEMKNTDLKYLRMIRFF